MHLVRNRRRNRHSHSGHSGCAEAYCHAYAGVDEDGDGDRGAHINNASLAAEQVAEPITEALKTKKVN